MPVTSFRKMFTPGEPQELYVAQPGDTSLQVRSTEPGGGDDPGASLLISFAIGGPDLEKNFREGLLCASGEFWSETGAGDSWWACVPGRARLAAGNNAKVALTVLVRSDGAKPAPRSGNR